MRSFVALVLTSLLVVATAATAAGRVPQLLARDPEKPGEKAHPVSISKADIYLLTAGRLCQTTVTLTFHNDADRVLEGELVFPLPENATVSGYALDVGGQLVEAVTIEKEKARIVFETETRRGVDPGIVEQVQGNNFRTRVHPIPAKGTRTIRVQYVSEPIVQGQSLAYPLPTQWAGATADVTIAIESISKSAPTVAGLPDLKFESQEGRYIARATLDKAALGKELVATLPANEVASVIVERHEKSLKSAENLDPKAIGQFAPEAEYYFVASDVPTPTPVSTTASRAKPKRIAIAWDASLSRGHADHAREFDLIKQHLAALGDVAVEVIAFRNVPDKGRTFQIKGGDARELIEFLGNLAYDGGTDLSAVSFARTSEGTPISYYLLFTDGLSNLGPELPGAVEAPVYAVSDDPRANHNLLRRLAAGSGGHYFNLQSLTVQQAQAAMATTPFSLLSIDCDAKEIADVYPHLPEAVQGRITIAGRLLAKSAKLTLNYGRDGVVTLRVPVTVSQEGAAKSSSLISRYWAQLKLADLSAAPEVNEAGIVELGKEFNLVTPFTSMIVLETAEQYLRYKIVPPKSRGEIYAKFMEEIEQQTATARREESAKIDRVVAMWNARLAWWNQDFQYAADFKYKQPAEVKAVALHAELSQTTREELERTASRQSSAGLPAAMPAVNNPAPAQGQPGQQVTQTAAVQDSAARPPLDNAPDFSLQSNGNGRPSTEGRGGIERRGRGDVAGRGGNGGGGGGGGLFGGGGGRGGQTARDEDVDGISDGATTLATGQANRGLVAGERFYAAHSLGRVDRAASGPESATQSYAEAVDDRGIVKAWTPDTPYLKALRSASAGQAYTIYLQQRKSFESLPAFYLDCADFFADVDPELALRILTNIPELGLDDGRLLRIAAHRLQQLKRHEVAIDLFERVVRLRPEEPQSFRDLALALADRADGRAASGDTDRALSDYRRSLELLHKVVMNQWDRFDEIEVIALMEANRLLAKLTPQHPELASLFDSRLVKLLDPDVRIVMTWDTDNTDIDLHVTEPSGETCVYNHNRTTIGGALSKDFTQGYGPEEYILRKSMPGQYKIQAHFFGNRDQQFVGPTTVQATIITHFGRADEKREAITLRLKDAKDMVDVGTITMK